MERFFEWLGTLVFVIAVLVAGVLARGYVLTYLWAWFIVTTFGVRPLNIPEALGVALIVGYILHTRVRPKNEKKQDTLIEMANAVVGPFFSLGIGWIIKQWM